MTRDTDERGKLLPEWEDPRVQIVYEILCDPELNTPPNPEEHWEGWVSRNIVAALSSAPAPAGHAEREALIERGAKALCKRFNPGRSLDEYLAPGAELWMRFKTEAEIVIDAALSNAPAPSEATFKSEQGKV